MCGRAEANSRLATTQAIPEAPDRSGSGRGPAPSLTGCHAAASRPASLAATPPIGAPSSRRLGGIDGLCMARRLIRHHSLLGKRDAAGLGDVEKGMDAEPPLGNPQARRAYRDTRITSPLSCSRERLSWSRASLMRDLYPAS